MSGKLIRILVAGGGVILGLAVLAGGAVVSGTKQRGMTIELPDQKEVEATPAAKVVVEKVKPSSLTLHIGSPVPGQVVNQAVVKVTGVTGPGAEVAINDKETLADSLGKFSDSVELDEGENTIVVVANDALGNYEEEELVVTYEP